MSVKVSLRIFISIIVFFGFNTAVNAQNVIVAKSYGDGGYDIPSEVKTLPNGTSYILGNFTTTLTFPTINTVLNAGTSQNIFILKVDSNGNVLQAIGFGGPTIDYSRSLAVDDTGNVYVTGFYTSSLSIGALSVSGSPGLTNFFICKFSPTLTPIWLNSVNGVVNYAIENTLELDNNNNIIIAGAYNGTAVFNGSTSITSAGASDAFCAKYSNAGVFQWARSFGGTATEIGQGLAVDASNNIYVGGSFFSTSCSFGSQTLTKTPTNITANGFLIKLSPSGINLDLKQLFANNVAIKDIRINVAGEVVLGGTFNGPLTINSASVTSIAANESFVCKLNSALQTQWLIRAGAPPTGPISLSTFVLYGLAQNNAGDIFITGYFSGAAQIGNTILTTLGSSSVFFAALDNNGNWKWGLRGGSSAYDIGVDVDVDTAGYAYFIGQFSGIAIFGTQLLLSPTSNPNVFWAKVGECDSSLATITTNGSSSICSGLGTQLVAPVSIGNTYQWVKDGAIIPFAVDTQYVANTAGNYQVVVTNGGCTDTSLVTPITVNQSPTVTLSAPVSQLCENQSAIPLTTSPNGGLLSGTGLVGTSFNPTLAGPGTYAIQYAYQDANNGCSDTATLSLQVFSQPTSVFTPVNPLCENQASITLTQGFPAGGQYFGTGITSSSFNPQIGTGSYAAGYRVANAQGCADTSFQTIVVNPAPNVSLAPLGFTCNSTFVFPLTGGLPTGGTYSGTAVVGSNFYPFIAGAGSYPIAYTVQNANGCSNTSVDTIHVDPPTVTLGTVNKICANNPAFPLTVASPSGGTYLGTGVSNNQFDAAIAGVGMHKIAYTVTNSCGTASDTFMLEVVPLPLVNFSLPAGICNDANSILLTTGNPTGGNYSGSNVSGNNFDPSGLNPGFYTIQYSYTDTNSCSAQATDSIEVFGLPTVTLTSIAPVCEDAPNFTLTNGAPIGGNYSGSNVLVGDFIVSNAPTGYSVYTYNYSDANGCSALATDSILIVAKPTPAIIGDSTVCIGDTVQLSVFPAGLSYSWSTAENSPTIAFTGNSTTTLSVTATDIYGCSANDTIQVIVNQLPVVSAGNYVPICANEANVPLNNGTPNTGSFGGNFVVNQEFTTSLAPFGSNIIYYSYTDTNGCTAMDTASILVNPLPNLTKTNSVAVCDNAAPIELNTFSPVGGNYSGSGIQNDSLFATQLTAGYSLYTYEFVDGNGCSSHSIDSVLIHPLPNFSIVGDTTICLGDTTFLTADNASYSYQWNSGQTTATIAVSDLINSSYSVTATSVHGCTAVRNVGILVNALPAVSAGNYAAVCANNALVTLSGTPVGGQFTGTGISSNQFNPAQAAIGANSVVYSYTDANGCSAADTTNLSVHPLPVVTVSPISTVCEDAAPFTLTSGSPIGGQYAGNGILNNIFTPSASIVGAINYTYTFTDSNACSNTASSVFYVNPLPTFSFAGNQIICEGDTTSINAIGSTTYTYTWANGNTGATASFSPSVSNFLSVLVADTAGCFATDSVLITVNTNPIVSAGIYAAACQNEAPVTLNASTPSGGNYTYLGNQISQVNPSLFSPGTYDLVYNYTAPNGCSAADTTVFEILPLPQISITNTLSLCENEAPIALNLAIPTGGNYTGIGINNNIFDAAVPPIGFATYTYTYTDASNCTATVIDSIEVKALPTVALTGDTAVCLNDTIHIQANSSAASFAWSQGASSNANFEAVANNAGISQYFVTATATNGCASTASISVQVNSLPVVSLTPLAPICVATAAVQLTNGQPIGGTYSGTSVVGDSLFIPSNSPSALITYTYADSNGCANTTSQSIQIDTLPIYQLSGNQTMCDGDTTILSIQGSVNVIWNNGATTTSLEVSPSTTTVYTASITTGNACTVVDSIEITLAYSAVLQLDSIGLTCQNAAPIELTATPSGGIFSGLGVIQSGSTYTFDPQQITTDSALISYAYLTTDGCQSAISTPIYIEQKPFVTLTNGTAYCEGDGIDLTVELPYSILWNDSLYTNEVEIIAALENATLPVILQSSQCSFDSIIELTINTLPLFQLPNDTSLCSVNSIQLLGPSTVESYLWSTGETANSIEIEGAYLTQSNNEFWLEVTSDFGCQFIDTIAIERVFCNKTLDVFLLYPNPTEGNLTLQYNSLEEIPLEFNLFTAIGASLGENLQAINIGKNTYQFDLSYLASGVYYLTISAGNGLIVKEVIVSK